MIFDSDVLVWALRGKAKAGIAITSADAKYLSAISWMELVAGARNKHEQKRIVSFLTETDLEVLPITENIGHRAMIYIQQHKLSSGMGVADALIAATAVENDFPLMTCNWKHFVVIEELKLIKFIVSR